MIAGKIPVNIISGFLGSGKTTAIIRLLEQKSADDCWAIVINEYGKISIDGQTLRSRSTSGTVYDITGGCICCSAKAHLHENLGEIVDSGVFQRIIIEPTGLGGVEMITEIVSQFHQLQLMQVICLVDITALNNLRIQRNMIYRAQILRSEIIVFSKCDLIDDPGQLQQIRSGFQQQFPDKLIYLDSRQLHSGILSDISILSSQETFSGNSIFGIRLKDQPEYFEFHYKTSGINVYDIQSIENQLFVNKSIVRAKGYLHTPEGWQLFNYTLTGKSTELCTGKASNELIVIADSPEIAFSLT